MRPATHPSALRIAQTLREAGLDAPVVEFDQPTRTSAEAAEAIGCTLSQIAKSVVLRDTLRERAVVVVACGDRRVSEAKAEALLDTRLGRADAQFVRASTGFPIGGVSPLGLPPEAVVLLDRGLQRFDRVWAAAGTPNAVFSLSPADLARLTGAPWCDLHVDA